MKADVLVFAVHPDDAELCCSGTIAKLTNAGKKVAIVDLTQGELGSRGTPQLRLEEAQKAGEILGIAARENLGLRDGFFGLSPEEKLALIKMIRRYRPEVILANAPFDRHPDHGRASTLAREANFLSGLRRIETEDNGQPQEAWRAGQLFYYIQDHHLEPDFVVDITDFWEQKEASFKAFASQFYDPESDEPETHISSLDFLRFIESRARITGHMIGATFGEGFISDTPLKVESPLDLA